MCNSLEFSVCATEKCSACGACVNICPRGCISYCTQNTGTKVATIDTTRCISCGLCKKICPQLNEISGEVSSECYAAWSLDENVKHNSASGGVASELYRLFIDKKGSVAGVYMTPEHKAVFSLTDQLEDITAFRNSKYVYSDTGSIFSEVEVSLKQDKQVLFIGLPCQVAALKSFLQMCRVSTEQLWTVDIVCHGVTPDTFLTEHIQFLENKYKKLATQVEFRDPDERTSTFTFSLKNEKSTFYKKKVKRNDVYQIGYHSGITYRDNCYSCQYASPKRQGDLTIADFAYVGCYAPCEYNNENVSCVLVNTIKGKNLIKELTSTERMYLEKRPIQEEINHEMQLNRPTIIPPERAVFLKKFTICSNFEEAICFATRKRRIKNEVAYWLHIENIKVFISKVMPKNVKSCIKKIIQRG